VSDVNLRNAGAIDLKLASAPRRAGASPAEFAIAATTCSAGLVLATQQSCSVSVLFRPSGATGSRSASLQIEHDWVGGGEAVALLGSSGSSPPPATTPPIGGSGGGGALSWLSVIACALAAKRRPRSRLSA